MCQAIREMWNDGWNDGLNEGISRGKTDGIQIGRTEGIQIGRTEGVALSAAVFRAVNAGLADNAQIAEQCGCTVEDVEEIRRAFGL